MLWGVKRVVKTDKKLKTLFNPDCPKDISIFPLLGPDFYQASAPDVARNLLGKILESEVDGELTAGIIVETEAYLAYQDPASHSFRGRTPRNKSMFARGGTAYVYKCYGVHHCFNIVTGQVDVGEAVLIRAIEPLTPLETMEKRRFGKNRELVKNDTKKSPFRAFYDLTNGPGKLTLALGIALEHDGLFMGDEATPIKVRDPAPFVSNIEISTSTRVGISQGQDMLLRFFVSDSPWVSRVPGGTRRSQRG
jgi:DNA-3-methyladenine glycosylase